MSNPGLLIVPGALVASHHKYFGAEGDQWIEALPGLAAECLARWRLRPDGAPGFGAVALVLPVVRVDGTRAVLKLQPVDNETVGEGTALRLWAGRGAVRLLEHDPGSGSMLLARLNASRSLATVADDIAAVEIIAGLLRTLNAVTAPAGIRRLADVIGVTLEAVPRALAAVRDDEERDLLRTSAARVSELLTEPIDGRLLHWDLHYDNVLAAPDPGQPWLAIDPKPLAGDSGFELLPALWNRWQEVTSSGDVAGAVLRRFDAMTTVLGLGRRRSAAWTIGRVLQNAVWDLTQFDEHAIQPAHRRIAEVLLASRA